MNHRRIKDRIEEYVDHTLSLEEVADVERHMEECSECRAQVDLTRMTRQFVRDARLEGECAPHPRFAQSVVAAIEQQKENYLFWSPVRLLAVRAIPLMALLAFILAAVAYAQFVPALSANGSGSYAESYLDLSPAWEQERLLFSNTATDFREPANSVTEQPSESPGSGR